jgi:hypothetical protein
MIATGANRPLRGTVDLVGLIGGAVVPDVDRKRISERYAPQAKNGRAKPRSTVAVAEPVEAAPRADFR